FCGNCFIIPAVLGALCCRRVTGKPPMVVASGSSMPALDRLRRGEHDLVRGAFTEVPEPPPDEPLGLSSEGVLIEREPVRLALLPGGSRTDGSQVAAGKNRRRFKSRSEIWRAFQQR
ncbi:MAG: hypothetical protein KGM92_15340, partial [Acidobacteriota bacterium]|nr:hypothetical protein [Acidobacteriota bacterium]